MLSPTFSGCPRRCPGCLQHFQIVPNMFRSSPTFVGCPQHVLVVPNASQVVPNIFRLSPNTFRLTSTYCVQDAPSMFRSSPTMLRCPQRVRLSKTYFRLSPPFLDCSQHFYTVPIISRFFNIFRCVPNLFGFPHILRFYRAP